MCVSFMSHTCHLLFQAPSFSELVSDVAATIESCAPADTYSMMDTFTAEAAARRCYVNPFVGEGRYARFLRHWLTLVPKKQILLLNFDEWTADAAGVMRVLGDFLALPAFEYVLDKAHNAHLARSVHVAQEGAAELGRLKEKASRTETHTLCQPHISLFDATFPLFPVCVSRFFSSNRQQDVAGQITTEEHCVLHRFFKPFQLELDALLEEYSYPPMRWLTAHKLHTVCADATGEWARPPARRSRQSA